MDPLLLVLNAGSSSLKYAAFRGGEDFVEVDRGMLPGGEPDRAFAALDSKLGAASRDLAAVGHRFVHGGPHFADPVRVDDAVAAALEELVAFDPLHQTASLAVLGVARRRAPAAIHVACFDTAFHRGHPEVADVVPLPKALRDAGLRRYGFHGLSFSFVAERLRGVDPDAAAGRVVVAHLGSGASLCALKGGRSMDSTMTFSPMDGLVMATRPGALDAGALLWLLGRGHDRESLERMLWRESGLLALSGTSGDLRELLESPAPEARLAVDVFVRAAVKGIASMAASLGGLDALVFTAGIGENQPVTRGKIARGLEFLGVTLDVDANAANAERISSCESRVRVFVLPTDEERAMAALMRPYLVAAAAPAAPGAGQP